MRKLVFLANEAFISERALIALAAFPFASDNARADSVIDAGVRPYFVFGGWVTALVFLGLGFFILRKAIHNRSMAAAAPHWPTTDGTVISADVVKRVAKSDDEFDRFIPQIRYEYSADGIRRQGKVIRIGLEEMGYLQEKKAREHLALYPVSATISVRYDPETPEYAVLEIGQMGVTRKILAGSIFAGLGIAAILFAIWSVSLPTR